MKQCGSCIYARDICGANVCECSKTKMPVNKWGEGCDRFIEKKKYGNK